MRFSLLLPFSIILALSACGQRGSLYLPPEPEQEPVLENSDEPPEADEEREREQGKDGRNDGN